MASFREQVSKAPRRTLKQRRTDHGEVTALHGTLGLSLLARPTDEHAAPERGLLTDIYTRPLENILSVSIPDVIRGGLGWRTAVWEEWAWVWWARMLTSVTLVAGRDGGSTRQCEIMELT